MHCSVLPSMHAHEVFNEMREPHLSFLLSKLDLDTSILNHVYLLLFIMFLGMIMLFGVIIMSFLS